jgi:hypothetical protein
MLSTPSGRISISLMMISSTQTLRKNCWAADGELRRAVGLDLDAVVLAGLERVGGRGERLAEERVIGSSLVAPPVRRPAWAFASRSTPPRGRRRAPPRRERGASIFSLCCL